MWTPAILWLLFVSHSWPAAGCWRLLLSAPQMPALQLATTPRQAEKLLSCAFSTSYECSATELEILYQLCMTKGEIPHALSVRAPSQLRFCSRYHTPVGGARGCSAAVPLRRSCSSCTAQLTSTASFPRCFFFQWVWGWSEQEAPWGMCMALEEFLPAAINTEFQLSHQDKPATP